MQLNLTPPKNGRLLSNNRDNVYATVTGKQTWWVDFQLMLCFD
jgi:hypothetical protein